MSHPYFCEGGHLGVLLGLFVPQPLGQGLAVVLAGKDRGLEVVCDRRDGDQGLSFVTGVSRSRESVVSLMGRFHRTDVRKSKNGLRITRLYQDRETSPSSPQLP